MVAGNPLGVDECQRAGLRHRNALPDVEDAPVKIGRVHLERNDPRIRFILQRGQGRGIGKRLWRGTRDLLGGTFKIVNEHFGRMFPELFGGGNARLVMTGDEILDSGVQVMAQPPGKKNQSINLLSGGEKALTAIALVFAIFQLNPAPFCLLDEVDAPLDDSNTERFAKLVATMSKGTQFLFISHNKITMQMAEQLIGVTMQEQGVSRIVAVDMESAISMVDTV